MGHHFPIIRISHFKFSRHHSGIIFCATYIQLNELNFEKVKKTAVILLLLIYGSATMGATAHLHYCMDEFVGWSLFNSDDEKCGKCGMEEKDKEGCCKDEHKYFKLKDDQQKAHVAQMINPDSTHALSVPVINISSPVSLNNTLAYPSCHAPPGIVKKRLHVLHCIFLI